MEIQKPNIHLLQHCGEHFFYDVNTNAILSVPAEISNFLAAWEEGEEKRKVPVELEDDIQFLEEQGYLGVQPAGVHISHFETGILEDLYRSSMSTMILQVTQNCNLRCEYCVYSGSYANRIHTNKRMSIETAKKAIDFLAERSSGSNEISIGFYGGEPLLEMDLIKEAVEYAGKVFLGKRLAFHMTTNATLLNTDNAEFLVANNFHLTISLDGPREVHNRNRIFAGSSRGTFDTVMKNIESVRQKFPGFVKQLAFNAVIDLSENVSCSSDFFLNYDTVKDIGVAGNYINPVSRKERIEINPELSAVANYEIFKTYLYYCDREFFKTYKPTLYDSEIASIRQTICERFVGKEAVEDIICPGGQCLPGIQRFFVTCDGEFFPCERVDETSEELCIGNLEEGIQIEQAKKILNIAQLTAEQCKKCWAYKMCYQCISKAQRDGRLDAEARLGWCNQMRESTEGTIKNYITLKKYGCNFEEGMK